MTVDAAFRINIALLVILMIAAAGCGKKEVQLNEKFSTPEKTYRLWIEAGIKGDLAMSMECITNASRKMMDQQVRDRVDFVKRMVSNAAIFSNYSIIDKRISNEKAIMMTESLDKKVRIAVPFLREKDGWKVDLITMFAG